MRVAILLGDNFEQVEMTEPRTALEAAGAHTTLVSPVHGEIHGVQHDQELQDSFEVDLPLVQANPEDFDALLLPGGALNADSMRMVPEVQEFIRRMQGAGKPMAVICHAPWELVSAGAIEGRTLTSYYTLQDDIRNAGGTWLDREVVRDRNLVTSRQPGDIPAFNREMLALFAEHYSQATEPLAASVIGPYTCE